MDLVHSCKDKLAYFRIKELKDVLTQLGLPKQGKKQELVDKILSLISDEQGSKSQAWAKRNTIGKTGVVKIIDDTYRKMQTPGASDLVSKSQTSSDANRVKPPEEANESYKFDLKEPDMKVRCPCGSSLRTDSMIKCEDPRCQVWQHIECVIIPEKALEGVLPELPMCFYCEICRLKRADPFWVTIAHPLLPLKPISSNFNSDGSSTTQSMEKTYHLSRADKELLQRNEYDLQIWCMLLNDKVPFRMQWPQHSDLQVNGITMRTTNRPGAQLLGINGRDDGPLITTYSKEGINKVCLSFCDGRTFCIGIRIAKRRTVQQVLNMIPKETDGERLEEALARVCRCVGGGNATDDADSDSDLEVVADSITFNLRCPMSGSRIKVAGRFKPCIHMGCFDLDTFVELNQRSRKWQCPICLKNYSLDHIIIDPYFNRITSMMKNCGEDVTEIEVKPDGSWRSKNEIENKDLARWHLYDGSLSTKIEVQEKQGLKSFNVKQEDMSGSHTSTLKLGMRRNENGVWELSKPKSIEPPVNHVQENQFQNLLPTSSSDDQSVNQDGSGNVDTPVNNNNVHDLGSFNFDPTYEVEDRIPQVPVVDANVIVLSDSDDENNTVMAPPPNSNDMLFPSLGYSNNENGDYVIPQWQMPTYTQTGFQLFDTDANVSDALVDVPPINGYNFATNEGLGETSTTQSLPTYPNNEGNESLVDNPLAYGNDDPSLQILFPIPSRSGEMQQPHLNDHNDLASGGDLDNWISLSLRGGEQVDNDSLNVVNSKRRFSAQESDAASLGLSMNRDKGQKEPSNTRISDGPFSHPRQPRSVRPRLCLSIDSDSD